MTENGFCKLHTKKAIQCEKLTDRGYWNRQWANEKLPIVVDIQNDWFYRRYWSFLKRHLPHGNKSFLEVGCGTGKWLDFYYKHFGYQVFGCDFSIQACTLSKKNIQETKTPGMIICQDIFSPSFKQNTFDVVFSGGLIEHFKNPINILQKIVTLLKPNGILITSVPNLSSIYRYLQKKIDKDTFKKHYHISLQDLSRMYEDLGMEVEDIRYFGYINLFWIKWDELIKRSLFFTKLILPILGKVNALLFHAQKILPSLHIKALSPFILAIGVKRRDNVKA